LTISRNTTTDLKISYLAISDMNLNTTAMFLNCKSRYQMEQNIVLHKHIINTGSRTPTSGGYSSLSLGLFILARFGELT
jgi:hypothetical protein